MYFFMKNCCIKQKLLLAYHNYLFIKTLVQIIIVLKITYKTVCQLTFFMLPMNKNLIKLKKFFCEIKKRL